MWITIGFVVVFAALLIWQRSRLNRSTETFDPEAEYRPPASSSGDGRGVPPDDGSPR
jgi:hypothetical protein